jgi:hypothetical protein
LVYSRLSRRCIGGLLAGLAALLVTSPPAGAARRGARLQHAYLTDYGDGSSGGGALWQFDVNDGIAVCRASGDVLGHSLTVANGFIYEICGYFTRSHRYVRGIWTFADSGDGTVNAEHFAKADVAAPGDIAIGP